MKLRLYRCHASALRLLAATNVDRHKAIAAGRFRSELDVARVILQRIMSGVAGISPDMAYRIGAAFGTSAELWAGMQLQFDLYQAGKVRQPKIERFAA